MTSHQISMTNVKNNYRLKILPELVDILIYAHHNKQLNLKKCEFLSENCLDKFINFTYRTYAISLRYILIKGETVSTTKYVQFFDPNIKTPPERRCIILLHEEGFSQYFYLSILRSLHKQLTTKTDLDTDIIILDLPLITMTKSGTINGENSMCNIDHIYDEIIHQFLNEVKFRDDRLPVNNEGKFYKYFNFVAFGRLSEVCLKLIGKFPDKIGRNHCLISPIFKDFESIEELWVNRFFKFKNNVYRKRLFFKFYFNGHNGTRDFLESLFKLEKYLNTFDYIDCNIPGSEYSFYLSILRDYRKSGSNFKSHPFLENIYHLNLSQSLKKDFTRFLSS